MNHPKLPGSTKAANGAAPGAPARAPNAPAAVAPRPANAVARPAAPAAPVLTPQSRSGKVVHDERGTAMWDWLKQTGRNAIESTTRLLRKLEAPELKVEQPHEEELRIQPDSGVDAGGGYDPYNQPTKSRRTPTK